MPDSLLQIFLNQQFIKTSDSGNIESLNKAVSALKKNLTARKALIIPYTLVALDPQVSETDRVVGEVENIIIKNWSTFRNSTSTKDKATTYVRVVILQTLSEIASDDKCAAIIWLISRNVYPYYQAQKERDPVSKMLVDVGNKFESAARTEWRSGEPVIKKISELTINFPASKLDKVNPQDFIDAIKAGAVHSGWAPSAGGGENPHAHSQNNFHWPQVFSEITGQRLADTINGALATQNNALGSLTEVIKRDVNSYFTQFQAFFTDAAKTLTANATAANKRGNLLWWQQTLYSPLMDNSYRNAEPIISALAMSIDLSTLVGFSYPESVNYLLKEALLSIYSEEANTKRKFSYWLDKLLGITGDSRQYIKQFESDSEGRKPIVTALANTLFTNSAEKFAAETGIDPEQEISLLSLAMWVFNDIHAFKFTTIK